MAKSFIIDIDVNNEKLCIEDDNYWLMLLKADKAEDVERILNNRNQNEVDRLVNGCFYGLDKISKDDEHHDICALVASYPFNIAAAYGSKEVLGALLRYEYQLTLTN